MIREAALCPGMDFAQRNQAYRLMVGMDIDNGLPLVYLFGKLKDSEDIAGQLYDREHIHKADQDIIGYVFYCSILDSLLPVNKNDLLE